MPRACSRPALLLAVGALFLAQGCSRARPQRPPATARADLLNYSRALGEAIGEPVDTALVSLKVEKRLYRLTVEYQGTPVKQYPIVLGRNPVDDKRLEGDGCTPEGRFKVLKLYPHRAWRKFMWLDYPTAESRARFDAARKAGRIPRRATIGGQIGIHGVPNGDDRLIDERRNWTLGCISMRNGDIDEIYSVCREGTTVRILH